MQTIRINNSKGFSLIELMIVVAIVGILASVAYPSYIEQIYKTKRATAVTSILECAAILERRFTVTNTYTDDACDNMTSNDDYDISVAVTGLTSPVSGRNCTNNGNENCFTITAASLVTGDTACASLVYTHTGVKSVTPATSTTEKCWRTS